jgi:uncharacterized OB-fold protein
MTSAAPEPANRPGLVDRFATDEASRAFWTHLASGHLALPRCRDCQSYFFFPRRFCPSCRSIDIEWLTSAGRGTIFASSEVHVAFQGLDSSELPAVVGLVDLDEGVRIPARFGPIGRQSTRPFQIGDRVSIKFGSEPAFELPWFEPMSEGRAD